MPNNPKLFIISGGRSPSGSDKSDLRTVHSKPIVPRQLCLPYKRVNPHSIVMVGFQEVTLDRFLGIIDSYCVSRIIDVRVTPLFRGNGFSPDLIDRLLFEKNVEYIHIPELGRSNLQYHQEKLSKQFTYPEYVSSCRVLLEDIVKLTENGPTVMLSWTVKERESDLRVIVESLDNLGVDRHAIIA